MTAYNAVSKSEGIKAFTPQTRIAMIAFLYRHLAFLYRHLATNIT